jgi:AraC-like DNA-binding protein
MVYYLSGNPICPVSDTEYNATPGTLIATPPQTPHSEIARTAYKNLYFTVEAPADMPWAVAVQDSNRDLEETCRAILREAIDKDAYSEKIVELLLQRFDLLLRRASEKSRSTLSPAEVIVRNAERFIEEHYAEQSFRVAHVAAFVGASPSTLREAFHRCRDCSPRERLSYTRLRHALSFLRNSDLTLDVIAGRCGYDSASHLSRRVREDTGASPGSLRGGCSSPAAQEPSHQLGERSNQ